MSRNSNSTMSALSAKLVCNASQLCGGRRKLARCPSKFAPHSSRCSAMAASTSVEMPGGVFWLDKASHSSDVVYGEVRNALPIPNVMLSVGLLRKSKASSASVKGPLSYFLSCKGALILLYICEITLTAGHSAAELRPSASSQRWTRARAVSKASCYGGSTTEQRSTRSYRRWATGTFELPCTYWLESLPQAALCCLNLARALLPALTLTFRKLLCLHYIEGVFVVQPCSGSPSPSACPLSLEPA